MITARAYAKINLDLRVTGRRADGYHTLRTTFQSIALHDVLTFTRTRGPFALECNDPDCPPRGNLVERAAARLWSAAGRSGAPAGVRVRLDKRIPIAAGLGGGSADAAAALRALDRLWGLDLGAPRLAGIAASLGADVPFFLRGGTVLGEERGDALTPLADAPRRFVVLVVPPFGVSTQAAYEWFDAAAEVGAPRRERLRNDLAPAVIARHPEIGAAVALLRRAGAAHAAMSGSGSAVFGLFPDLDRAEHAAGLAAPRWRTIVTRTVPGVSYRRLTRPVLARK